MIYITNGNSGQDSASWHESAIAVTFLQIPDPDVYWFSIIRSSGFSLGLLQVGLISLYKTREPHNTNKQLQFAMQCQASHLSLSWSHFFKIKSNPKRIQSVVFLSLSSTAIRQDWKNQGFEEPLYFYTIKGTRKRKHDLCYFQAANFWILAHRIKIRN